MPNGIKLTTVIVTTKKATFPSICAYDRFIDPEKKKKKKIRLMNRVGAVIYLRTASYGDGRF